jgi:hypothetical protein
VTARSLSDYPHKLRAEVAVRCGAQLCENNCCGFSSFASIDRMAVRND